MISLTNFPHHPQALLVVGSTTSNKDGDFMLLQRTLIVFNSSDNALREETWKVRRGAQNDCLWLCKSGSEAQTFAGAGLFNI